jgi:hypothetical protein
MIELMHKYKHLLFTIILLRFLSTWFVFPYADRLYNGDSWLYEQYAISMMETGEYLAPGYGKWEHLTGDDPAGVSFDPFADMIRPPGLPLVLWGIYEIVGPNLGPWVFSVFNGLLSVPILVLILAFLRLFGMERYAKVCWIFVVDPGWILYSKEILTEPMFVVILLAALFFGVLGLTRLFGEHLPGDSRFSSFEHLPPAHLLGYSGLLFGLGTLFKPITLYVPLAAVLLFGILVLIRRDDFRMHGRWDGTLLKYVVSVALLFVISAQTVHFSWQLRNYLRHGSFAFTSIQAENLMTGHAAFVLSSVEGITHLEAQQRILDDFNHQHPDHGVYTFDRLSQAKSNIARAYIWEHPGHYMAGIFRGMVVTIMDPGRLVLSRTLGLENVNEIGLTNILARDGVTGVLKTLFRNYPALTVYMILHLIWLGAILVVAAWGFLVFVRRFPVAGLTIGLLFLYLWGLGGPSGYARFRMYLLPMMVIFAAFCPLADKITIRRGQ